MAVTTTRNPSSAPIATASQGATALMSQAGKKLCGSCQLPQNQRGNEEAHTCDSANAAREEQLQWTGELIKELKQKTDASGKPLFETSTTYKKILGVAIPLTGTTERKPVMERLLTDREINRLLLTNRPEGLRWREKRNKIVAARRHLMSPEAK